MTWSINLLERLNEEPKRRTRVVDIIPNDASITWGRHSGSHGQDCRRSPQPIGNPGERLDKSIVWIHREKRGAHAPRE
jgi:hypothetical protein